MRRVHHTIGWCASKNTLKMRHAAILARKVNEIRSHWVGAGTFKPSGLDISSICKCALLQVCELEMHLHINLPGCVRVERTLSSAFQEFGEGLGRTQPLLTTRFKLRGTL